MTLGRGDARVWPRLEVLRAFRRGGRLRLMSDEGGGSIPALSGSVSAAEKLKIFRGQRPLFHLLPPLLCNHLLLERHFGVQFPCLSSWIKAEANGVPSICSKSSWWPMPFFSFHITTSRTSRLISVPHLHQNLSSWASASTTWQLAFRRSSHFPSHNPHDSSRCNWALTAVLLFSSSLTRVLGPWTVLQPSHSMAMAAKTSLKASIRA